MIPSYLIHSTVDGPAVNISLCKTLCDVFLQQLVKPRIDIGACSVDSVHNGFHRILDCLPFNVVQFANVHSWFKLAAAHHQDYDAVKLEELTDTTNKFFLRPVNSCWLIMEPICWHLIVHFEPLKKYFLTVLLKSANSRKICTLD